MPLVAEIDTLPVCHVAVALLPVMGSKHGLEECFVCGVQGKSNKQTNKHMQPLLPHIVMSSDRVPWYGLEELMSLTHSLTH